jgi:hypothetical protein
MEIGEYEGKLVGEDGVQFVQSKDWKIYIRTSSIQNFSKIRFLKMEQKK